MIHKRPKTVTIPDELGSFVRAAMILTGRPDFDLYEDKSGRLLMDSLMSDDEICFILRYAKALWYYSENGILGIPAAFIHEDFELALTLLGLNTYTILLTTDMDEIAFLSEQR